MYLLGKSQKMSSNIWGESISYWNSYITITSNDAMVCSLWISVKLDWKFFGSNFGNNNFIAAVEINWNTQNLTQTFCKNEA